MTIITKGMGAVLKTIKGLKKSKKFPEGFFKNSENFRKFKNFSERFFKNSGNFRKPKKFSANNSLPQIFIKFKK